MRCEVAANCITASLILGNRDIEAAGSFDQVFYGTLVISIHRFEGACHLLVVGQKNGEYVECM